MHIIHIRFLFFSASKSTNLFVDKIMHIIQIRFLFCYRKKMLLIQQALNKRFKGITLT